MENVTCKCTSTYRSALTRGERYTVLAVDKKKGQIQVTGDNGRARWFPEYCFTREENVCVLVDYSIDGPILPDEPRTIEVTVKLSSGEERWCYFMTPTTLAECGDWIDGTKIRFHYNNRHLVVANELSEELIDRMLRYIDSQGELSSCTIPCGNAPPE